MPCSLIMNRLRAGKKEYLPVQNAYLTAELIRSRTLPPNPWAPSIPAYISQGSSLSLPQAYDTSVSDMEYVQNHLPDIPAKDRQRAEGLEKATQFRQWLVAPTSQLLLIHCDLQESSGISTFSVLCLMLAKALRNSPHFRPVVFFCGRHMGEQDVNAGGPGLIGSLTEQLLCQQSFDTGLLDSNTIQNALEGKLDAFCALFHSLIRHIPKETTLVCVIDGIKYYEREVYELEIGIVVVQLLDLL